MSLKKQISLNIKPLICAVLIALFFRSFVYEAYKIPTGSMIPTLQVGDYLFISKFAYGYSKYSIFGLPLINGRIWFAEPKRGDIIVFKLPRDTSIFYIKRLIGLPGDKIQVVNGILHINGKPVSRIYETNTSYKDSRNVERIYQLYEEILPNGVKYNTLDANINEHKLFPDQTEEYVVPDGHYFFMGDNRNNSIDSRFLKDVGFVPRENLVGRAEFLFWTRDLSLVDLITKLNSGRAFTRLKNE